MHKTLSTVNCNNCGKQGHLFHQCKLPITSYGIIACRSSMSGLQFLMIRRKDSFGYIDFIRGKYSLYNLIQLQNIIDEMSNEEKTRILTTPFEIMWANMWGKCCQYKSDEPISKKKYDQLLHIGIKVDSSSSSDIPITLHTLVENSSTNWKETEWEFPKGRRNQREKDLTCALREFEEETGISQSKISVIDNLVPFEEIFIGSNHKSYKHKYFLAIIHPSYENDIDLTKFQPDEVSKLEWKTLDQCLETIRPYHLEKKELIININKVLEEYRLYY